MNLSKLQLDFGPIYPAITYVFTQFWNRKVFYLDLYQVISAQYTGRNDPFNQIGIFV